MPVGVSRARRRIRDAVRRRRAQFARRELEALDANFGVHCGRTVQFFMAIYAYDSYYVTFTGYDVTIQNRRDDGTDTIESSDVELWGVVTDERGHRWRRSGRTAR